MEVLNTKFKISPSFDVSEIMENEIWHTINNKEKKSSENELI